MNIQPITTEEQVLCLILQELKEIKALMNPTKESIQCKYCGGTHENKGQIMACAKRAKKKNKESESK
jgi:hypothetical protein